jgi:hypothetical protein
VPLRGKAAIDGHLSLPEAAGRKRLQPADKSGSSCRQAAPAQIHRIRDRPRATISQIKGSQAKAVTEKEWRHDLICAQCTPRGAPFLNGLRFDGEWL